MNDDRPTGAYRDRLLRLLAIAITHGDLISVRTIARRLDPRPDQPNPASAEGLRWMNEDLS